MTFDEAYAEFKKASFGNEDFEQDCVVLFLGNPEADVSEIIKTVKKKCAKEYFESKRIAPNLYNEEGECFTDDIYFVQPDPTAEVNETNNITDEIREQGLKLARLMRTTAVLWKQTSKWSMEILYNYGKKKACAFFRGSYLSDLHKIKSGSSVNKKLDARIYVKNATNVKMKLKNLLEKEMKND